MSAAVKVDTVCTAQDQRPGGASEAGGLPTSLVESRAGSVCQR